TNDAPTLAAGVAAASEDGPTVDVDLAALGDDIDSDDDGTTLGYAITGAPTEGSASITGTTLTFNPGTAFQDLALGATRDVVVQVTATDAHGATAVSDITVTVTGTNEAPTDLNLSNTNVAEGTPGAVVGFLDAEDGDQSEQLTYTIVNALDGDKFAIVGNELQVASTGLDNETATSHSVLIKATDKHGASIERSFTITVDDRNEIFLTSGPDNVPGAATDDLVMTTANNLNATDLLHGGAGFDTLLLQNSGQFQLGSL
ncbi:Ig-like domain-containing protein, partial [Loktanella sp. DJP18]|uniref:cadherin repeat domain-containing protein n=1 Tax=Loktanella sp. DJP18 TaxID=3409788 RepID=UPI003BB716F8